MLSGINMIPNMFLMKKRGAVESFMIFEWYISAIHPDSSCLLKSKLSAKNIYERFGSIENARRYIELHFLLTKGNE